MKQIMKVALLCLGLIPCASNAQELDVDWDLYPDYSPKMNPDYSLLKSPALLANEEDPLPDHVHNGQTKFFPPVFNQSGGSCSMASRIGYMFTYEMNAYRNANGKWPENRYPSHFVWLMGRGNSGKYALIQHVGVPSVATYGGATYSHLFGNQKPTDNNFGWMQGYDKWFSAMNNRMLCPVHIPMSVKTEEGRQALKRWLYNHNGDSDYFGGGVAGIGVGINGTRKHIPSTPTNDEIGVTGLDYMDKWGAKFNHALTVVGYDDRIEFDLDGNGVKGEKDKDEVGAWIIVNSWGSNWANDGFVYCPYARATKTSAREHWWFPELFKVRKNYRPLRTAKIKMDYSRRSEIAISGGISTDLNATVPEKTIPFHHFQFAGDGKGGHSNPAPEIPMLGKWKEGLNYDPMEFGYDLTDLSSFFNKNLPLKYFLIIETRPWAQGHGKIYEASIIDYEFDREGMQVPFDITSNGVEIKNQGNKTIISTIVNGESYYEPKNLILEGNLLKWEAPFKSYHKIEGYRIYCNHTLLETIAAPAAQFALPENKEAITYSLSAMYENGIESAKVNVNVPAAPLQHNESVDLTHSGFSIPNIFNSKYEAATIEFWLRPHSLVDYNQVGGPGWDTSFKFHSNAIGSFVVGWDQENRITSSAATLKIGQWTHLAIVVNKNNMTLFVDGKESGTFTSATYEGIGGFEELEFGSSEEDNNIDAEIDEVRIWNYAKSAEEIDKNKNVEYSGSIMPNGLLGYYKGGITLLENRAHLRDYAGMNHAKIITQNYAKVENSDLALTQPAGETNVKINLPTSVIYAGIPVNFSAKYSEVVDNLCWTAEGTNVKGLYTTAPSVIFKSPGKHLVSVVASDSHGTMVKDECEVNVEQPLAPVADFYVDQKNIVSGEHVTFIARKAMLGYTYEWSMPGSTKEKAFTPNAGTTYQNYGTYKVKLTVTSPDGRIASQEKEFTVAEVAPLVDFEVSPSIIVKGETTFLKDKSKHNPNQWKWQIHNEKRDIFIHGQHSSLTPETPGIYDVTLFAQNGTGTSQLTHKRALTVCNADSKSGLLFNGAQSAVKLSKPLFTAPSAEMTFDCWINPLSLSSPCLGFGENGKLMFTTGYDGVMTLKIGTSTLNSVKNYVIADGWHHYAVTFSNGLVKFYRDGLYMGEHTGAVTSIPEIRSFTIGGSVAPLDGQIDEFRIWGSALDLKKIQHYANAPIADIQEAEATDKLMVYFDFNQSGGNVVDRTSNNNDGVRQGFGPDGDAWGLSQGVFALDLEEKDITDDYLKNCRQPFAYDGNVLVNSAGGSRFHALADWTLENAEVNGTVTTCGHVDAAKYNALTFTTGWDGFGNMKNHKVFQTFTLPAGDYSFIAKYPNKKTKAINSKICLVAAAGSGLPDFEHIDDAIAYEEVKPRNIQMVNTLDFSLAKATEISLGLLVNMSDSSCVTFGEFILEKRFETTLEADQANGFDLQIDGTGYSTLCLPYPTNIPEGAAAFVAVGIQGNQVLMEPVTEGIVPARTGVVVAAAPGVYHFSPSGTSSHRQSLLYGVVADETADGNNCYYKWDAQDRAGFYRSEERTLSAHHAYLVRPSDDTNEFYEFSVVSTGIEGIQATGSSSPLYDLSGRRVSKPVPGVYIDRGKKVLVR